MKGNDQDTLARAYAMLQALRKNIAELTSVAETYVTEYHAVLDMLEKLGLDVTHFRIPASEVQPRITSIPYGRSGSAIYSETRFVPKALLLVKLDAILIYFEITTSEKPRNIGFSLPDKL